MILRSRGGAARSFAPGIDERTSSSRLTTDADTVEAFGVVEVALPVPAGMNRGQSAQIILDGRIPAVATRDADKLRFRFSPRDARVWPYVIRSDFPGLDGRSGSFTAIPPPVERTTRASAAHANWWLDNPNPAAAEGVHPGEQKRKPVARAFRRDFAARMRRCQAPAPRQADVNR